MYSLGKTMNCSGRPVNLAPKHLGLRFRKSWPAKSFKLIESTRSDTIRFGSRDVRLEGGVPHREFVRELLLVLGKEV